MSGESDTGVLRNRVREQQQNRGNNGGPVTRVVPIVLPDGRTVQPDIHTCNESTNIHQENKLSKFEEGIENIHVEISEKIIEISENVEMISELQAESQSDLIGNEVKVGTNCLNNLTHIFYVRRGLRMKQAKAMSTYHQ